MLLLKHGQEHLVCVTVLSAAESVTDIVWLCCVAVAAGCGVQAQAVVSCVLWVTVTTYALPNFVMHQVRVHVTWHVLYSGTGLA